MAISRSKKLKRILSKQKDGRFVFRALYGARKWARLSKQWIKQLGRPPECGLGSHRARVCYLFPSRPSPDDVDRIDQRHNYGEAFICWYDQSPIDQAHWWDILESQLRTTCVKKVILVGFSSDAGDLRIKLEQYLQSRSS